MSIHGDAVHSPAGSGDESSPASSPPPARPLRPPSIHSEFISLSRDSRELYLRRRIPRISPPSPLSFYRDFVSQNLPCLISGAIDHWPALSQWSSSDYLIRAMGALPVTVALTPNGRADSLHSERLCLPFETEWPFSLLLDRLTSPLPSEVAYCQHQNSSFSTEFTPLHEDIFPLEFASVAFNDGPDAVNLWVGSSASVSALHHDSYENLYCVVRGMKRFLLYPPTDVYWLEERMYEQSKWEKGEGGEWSLRPVEGGSVPWPADVEAEMEAMAEKYRKDTAGDGEEAEEEDKVEGGEVEEEWDEGPLISRRLRARYANPMYVEVEAGEVLYLPSLWFHCVAQEGDEKDGVAIAVNHWYDMQHGPLFAYYQHLRQRVQEHYEVLRARRKQRQ